jgi:hypothetical protein
MEIFTITQEEIDEETSKYDSKGKLVSSANYFQKLAYEALKERKAKLDIELEEILKIIDTKCREAAAIGEMCEEITHKKLSMCYGFKSEYTDVFNISLYDNGITADNGVTKEGEMLVQRLRERGFKVRILPTSIDISWELAPND